MEQQMGYNTTLIEQAVINNKHNHLSATYHLLLKKYLAQGVTDLGQKHEQIHRKQVDEQFRAPTQDMLV